MIRAWEQVADESSYPHFAALRRLGGTLKVGENFSTGAFARNAERQQDQGCRCQSPGLGRRWIHARAVHEG